MNEHATDIRVVLKQKGYVQQPDGSYALAAVASRVPNAKPQSIARQESLDIDQEKIRSKSRIRVCVTRFGRRLLDVDNLGGAKLVIDQLRYAKLIPDDSPEHIELELKQAKVKNKDKEGTEVIIEQL